jgi:peptidoglycan hydrolase CwlO-like protein
MFSTLRNKDTMKKLIIPIALGVIIVVLLFWNVENRELANTYKLEKEQIQRHIKKQIDSVNRVIQAKDKAILKAMIDVREAEVRVEIAEENVIKIKAKYDQIRYRPTRNDRERDSIRAKLYPSSVGL